METTTNIVKKHQQDVISYPEMLHEPGSIGFLEKILISNIIFMISPKLIIETGLFKGYTHKFVSNFIATNKIPDCRVVSFDLPDVVNQYKKENPDCESNGISEIVGGTLPDSLQSFLRRTSDKVDFAIIDSDHSYQGVLNDLKTIGPSLSEGGYIFCHDYRPFDEKYIGTSQAIDEFSIANGYDYLPLMAEAGTVWGSALLRKPEEYRTRNKRGSNKIKNIMKRFIK